jgi:integrase
MPWLSTGLSRSRSNRRCRKRETGHARFFVLGDMVFVVVGSRVIVGRLDHVFTTTRGTPLDAAIVTRSFQRAPKQAGFPRPIFHDLRHSAATFLLAQGFALEDVKNLLGHSSIVLTSNTYGHVVEQRQRQVAMGMYAVLCGWTSA